MARNLIIKIHAYFAMKAKIADANSRQKCDGERRFIIPFNDGTMEVLTKKEAKAMKVMGYLPEDFTDKTIYGACFYYTKTSVAHEKVQSAIPDKELRRRMKSYYSWFEKYHSI